MGFRDKLDVGLWVG